MYINIFAYKEIFIDWAHKHLKNRSIANLWEHFCGLSESDLWKHKKNNISQQTYLYIYGSQTFWCLMKFYFVHIVKVSFVFKKQSLCLYSSPYMHKTLLTLQFYEKSLGELIFSWATKNLNMFYFTHPTGRVLKK